MFLRQGFCHIYTPIDFEGASLGIRRSSSPRSADHGRLRNVSGQRWPGEGAVDDTRMGGFDVYGRAALRMGNRGLFVDTLWSDFCFTVVYKADVFELHSALLWRGSDDFHAVLQYTRSLAEGGSSLGWSLQHCSLDAGVGGLRREDYGKAYMVLLLGFPVAGICGQCVDECQQPSYGAGFPQYGWLHSGNLDNELVGPWQGNKAWKHYW